MREVPALAMMALTSAKSTFTRPGTVMMSEIPRTPCLKMSSATLKASVMGRSGSTQSRRRSLGMMMRVSTAERRDSMASMACCLRRRPSKEKGVVTMATVKMPIDLATLATTGAAPEPVPPPMPAVTKTMSEPATAASMAALLSAAAFCPMAGLPPAPRPRVRAVPSWSLLDGRTGETSRAWASVLKTKKSTPVRSDLSIRLTALEPPPPTPMTLIEAWLAGRGVVAGAGADGAGVGKSAEFPTSEVACVIVCLWLTFGC